MREKRSPVAAKVTGKAKIHCKAFEDTLSMIAKQGVAVFQAELEATGDYGEYINEDALERCLRQFFGESGTELLMHRIRTRNAELSKLTEAE